MIGDGEHESCRIPRFIFRCGKVFNTSVDKRVEKAAASKANYTIVSTLTRFALFLCIECQWNTCDCLLVSRWKRKTFAQFRRSFSLSLLTLILFYFSQYHFGGRSRCTLMVCFASVMSYHRP